MKSNIKITVITVTFRAEAVLQRTLDSMLQQTWPYVEHVVVDGASKDNTVKMAEAYQTVVAATHPDWRVKIQSEPDGGLYDAMNKGLERTTGDYVVFMNAGDCFHAGCSRPSISRGSRSARACSSAIRLSMPARILPRPSSTT